MHRSTVRRSAAGVAALVAVVAVPSVASAADAQTAGAGPSPRIPVMVTGTSNQILFRQTITARPVTVRTTAGATCRVNGGLPLAALEAARAAGGPSISLRDFQNCSPTTGADSGGLFVQAIGGRPATGNNGWSYKVNSSSGTTGGADPSGPFGDGPLENGDQVLWFYCRPVDPQFNCQRSLDIVNLTQTARVGRPARFSVTGIDNNGDDIPVQGARVSFAGGSARTNARGVATVIPRRVGLFLYSASRTGMVPAFPDFQRVRRGGSFTG